MAALRNIKLIATVVVLAALAISSDGAPKLARRRRATDFIVYNRDTAFVNPHQSRRVDPVPQARPNAYQHEAHEPRVVLPANSDDYDDRDDQIVSGASSLEGLILGDFVPGLIYGGQREANAALVPRAVDEAARQIPSAASLQQPSNPASRCILCDGGDCPVCYQPDHNGVCRKIYGCSVWDPVSSTSSRLHKLINRHKVKNGTDTDDDGKETSGVKNVQLRPLFDIFAKDPRLRN